MNPRILKKLCKRADPYLAAATKHLERIMYEPGESGQCMRVEKKYLERWAGKPNKHGYFEYKKNTIGYGETTGYYEREWSDTNAYSLLFDVVCGHFTEWEEWDEESYPMPFVAINNPRDLFFYAEKMRAVA